MDYTWLNMDAAVHLNHGRLAVDGECSYTLGYEQELFTLVVIISEAPGGMVSLRTLRLGVFTSWMAAHSSPIYIALVFDSFDAVFRETQKLMSTTITSGLSKH